MSNDVKAECLGCKRLRVWAESAWRRGHMMGLDENKRIAKVATEALAEEREAHAATNARLTELLLAVEEERDRLKGYLKDLI